MIPLKSDRTRTLKETVAELTPAEAVRKFKPFFGLTPHGRLKFFQESCDELVSHSIDELWYFYGGKQNESDFGALLEVRDNLLKEVSKPKIQYIREEFERVGVRSRDIDFENLNDPRPYFSVNSHFAEITVQGNLYNEIDLGNGKKRYQPFLFSTNFEDLREILLDLPTNIGEVAFWESVKVYKFVNQITGEQQKTRDEFEHEERRRKSRKESPRVRIVGGKYAGRFGHLIDRSGDQVRVEIELSPEQWIQARIPKKNVELTFAENSKK